MKIVFICLAPRTQEESHSLMHAIMNQGFSLEISLSWKEKEYLITGISAIHKEQGSSSDTVDENPLTGNKIVFIEQGDAWLVIDKSNMVRISKTEDYVERIKGILQNYHQTVLA